MSVSISRGKGVTVLTLNSDPQSLCPPACQILRGLCWNPACCSLSPRRGARGSLEVLGTLQIMVGLVSLGLAVILCNSPGASWWEGDYTAFPFWMSGVFVAFGVVSILSEKFPSPCLLILSSILLLSGVCFAGVSIVLYSINMSSIYIWGNCERVEQWDDYGTPFTTISPSPQDAILREHCRQREVALQIVLQGINGILIILSVLELCVVLSAAVEVIKTLRRFGKEEKQSAADPVQYQPLVC